MQLSHILCGILAASALPVFAGYEQLENRDLRRATAWAAGSNGQPQIDVIAKFTKRPASEFFARPSPVKYLWVVRDRKDDAAAVVNQDANLIMLPGNQVINVSTREVVDKEGVDILKAGILQNISPDLILEYKMGSGEGRNLFLWTAVDCPSCTKLDNSIDAITRGMDGVIRMVPTSINPINKFTVNRIWCSSDPAKAWSVWMREKKLPNPSKAEAVVKGCERGYTLAEDLSAVLTSVGWPIYGTPSIIYENGFVSPHILRTVGERGSNLLTVPTRVNVLKTGFVEVPNVWKALPKAKILSSK